MEQGAVSPVMWRTHQSLQAFKMKGKNFKLKASRNYLYKKLLQIEHSKKIHGRISVAFTITEFHYSSYLGHFSVLIQSKCLCKLQLRDLYGWKANTDGNNKGNRIGMPSEQNRLTSFAFKDSMYIRNRCVREESSHCPITCPQSKFLILSEV